MNPGDDGDIDELYQRLSAEDPGRPSERARRAIMRRAADLAAGQVVDNDPARSARKHAARRLFNPRAGIYAGLAAAALAGILIAPRFLTRPPAPSEAVPPASVQRAESEVAHAAMAPPLNSATRAMKPLRSIFPASISY